MKMWLVVVVVALLVVLSVLAVWRHLDRRTDAHAWDALRAENGVVRGTYDSVLVRELPEPAQRYFDFMIAPGSPLHTVVELQMVGELGLGTKASHQYNPMSARQILAPPHGLVWQVDTGPLSGSDGALPAQSWTRFWLFGLVPVARISGDDHQRSAFGRVVAEAAFWVPASLLPSEHVRWESIDDSSARAIVQYGTFEQAVEITVNEEGAPIRVLIQRWSNENPEKQYREQPFGGALSEFRAFDGYRLPTRVEGGNHFGTADYFPFFKAEVTDVRFPGQDAER